MSLRRRFGLACPARTRVRTLTALGLCALLLGGCANGDPVVTGSLPAARTAATSPTIAFESIDGPPRPVFDRLVTALSAEAESRNLPVISRNAAAAYRVRAFLVPLVEKRKRRATLAWAWDVYDASGNHAFRLSGEEPLGAPRSDVWAQADDKVLARIAAKGLADLTARLGRSAPAAPASPREPAGAAVAYMESR